MPYILEDLYAIVDPHSDDELEITPMNDCQSKEDVIDLLNHILYTVFHLTEKYEEYTKMFIDQKYFSTSLLKWLYSGTEVACIPAIKIMCNISSKRLDSWYLTDFVTAGVIPRLLELIEDRNTDVVWETMISLSNIMTSEEDNYLAVHSHTSFIPNLIKLLTHSSIKVSYEAVILCCQIIQIKEREHVEWLVRNNILRALVDTLGASKIPHEFIAWFIECVELLFQFYKTNLRTQAHLIEEFDQIGGVEAVEKLLDHPNYETNRVIADFLRDYYNYSDIGPMEMKEEESDEKEFYSQYEIWD